VRPRGWAAAFLAALALAGCGVGGDSKIDGPVAVYVSLPLSGARAVEGRDAADGARLALEQAGGKAGSLEVRATFLDDARGQGWDPAAVGENARKAVRDSSAAAYIGELDSEPTRGSVPVTNDAGLVQVSPGAGGVDLTRPAAGYPDTPDRYRPSGDANFARTVPADDLVAEAAAQWASELGLKRVTALSDGSPFQNLMAADFTEAAQERGVQVTRSVAGQKDEGKQPSGPVYDAGTQTLTLQDGAVLRSSAELDPSRLPGRDFATQFRSRFQRDPGPYAAYGYEAMEVVLRSIASAGTDASQFRDNVRGEVFGATRPGSVLGDYSISSDGDTTECMIQRYRGAQPLGAPCPSP
jgi:branched-chain amino acid transport system substrate-binding protein